MASQVGVSGLSELLETLRRLPAEIGSKGGGPIRAALREAGKDWKETAEKKAPVGEDTPKTKLRDNVTLKRDPRPAESGFAERYAVSFSKRAFWGGFVELGTSKQSAQPWLRPTFDERGGPAIEIFTRSFRQKLDAAVRKARK